MNHYFCITDYYATGEGSTVWLSLECENTEEDAKQSHIKRFKLDEYFHCGIKIIDVKKEKDEVKDILSSFFSRDFVDFLSDSNKASDGDKLFHGFTNNFTFTFYLNRS